jgi:Nucleotidyltransferase of unknown function (DUF6036)
VIDKSNLKALFTELDQHLVALNAVRSITIYGGAALIALDIHDRATVDIDIFQPRVDSQLLEAIRAIGKKNKLGEYWLNSTGAAFAQELPPGWASRTTPLYRGKALQVFLLSRQDLIFTKILAELDRQEDMADLLKLRPTPAELNAISPHLISLEKSKIWQNKIKEIIDFLLSKNT